VLLLLLLLLVYLVGSSKEFVGHSNEVRSSVGVDKPQHLGDNLGINVRYVNTILPQQIQTRDHLTQHGRFP